MQKTQHTFLSALALSLVAVTASVFMSCAGGAGGGSVGGVVIDTPQKLLEAEIVGHVYHQDEPIAGATVTVKGYEFSAVTDKNGRFRIEFKAMAKLGVSKKRVQLEASAEGYRTRSKGVYVEQRRITTVTIDLLPRY